MTDLELLKQRVEAAFTSMNILSIYRIEKADKIPHLPFARFWFSSETLTGSDDRVSIRRVSLNIELITAEKRFDLENALEKEFEEFEATKNEDFDTSDEVFVETFVFDVIQKIRR